MIKFLRAAFARLRPDRRGPVKARPIEAARTASWRDFEPLEPRLLLAGDPAPDLVAFAKALDDAGIRFFGAAWCPHCTAQKQLFEDGGQFLPFVEVTNPDRSANQVAIDENVPSFPTWEYQNGSRAIGIQSLDMLETQSGIAIPMSPNPSLAPLPDVTLFSDSPLHISVDGYDPNDDALTYEITVETISGDAVVSATLLEGNRSARIIDNNFGTLVVQLFEDAAPLATQNLIQLAELGFYDGKIVHRTNPDLGMQIGGIAIANNQIVQEPSPLGSYADQFSDDLRHNRTGVLTAEQLPDGTNSTDFIITSRPIPSRDFENTVFGVLVEGDSNRNAINNTAAVSNPLFPGEATFPRIPVTIDTIEIFEDEENAVFRLAVEDGTSGEVRVTVTATDADDNTAEQIFNVAINSVTFPIGGDGEPTGIKFIEDDQTTGTITVKGATAAIELHGMTIPDPALVPVKGKTYVIPATATNLRVDAINITVEPDVAFSRRKLTLKAKRSRSEGDDGMIDVVTLNSDGGLNKVDGKNVHFRGGAITVNGPLRRFVARHLTDVSLAIQNVGADPSMTKIAFDAATNFTVDAQESPVDIKGRTLVNDNPDIDGITSTYARSVKIKEDASFSLVLSGDAAPREIALKSARFGTLAGNWEIANSVGKVTAKDISGFAARITGDAKGITSKGAIMDSEFEANTIGTLKARKDILRTNVTLNEPFNPNDSRAVANKTFKAGQNIADVVLRSGNSVNKIEGKNITNSTFYIAVVGHDNDVLPDFRGDFVSAAVDNVDAQAFLKTFKVSGPGNLPIWMNNVFVAAPSFGSVKIGRAGASGGENYGFATVQTRSFVYKALDKENNFKASREDLSSPPGTVFLIDPTSDLTFTFV